MKSGCWHFKGPISNNGYGKVGWHGKVLHAHRLSYILLVGDPGELFVLHKCDNRKCVNPEHLFLGTAKDNTHDMLKKGRHKSLKPVTVKPGNFCKRGHLLTEENLRFVKAPTSATTYRRCMICEKEQYQERKNKHYGPTI